MYERTADDGYAEHDQPDKGGGDPYGDNTRRSKLAPDDYATYDAVEECGYPQDRATPRAISARSASQPSVTQTEALPFEPLPFEPDPKTPLRLMYAGPHFGGGGVEQHAQSLARFFNPQRVRLTKYLLTGANDPQPSRKFGSFSIVSCGSGDLSHAVGECDVLLLWGEGFNDRLAGCRPLCIYLAHGECGWTRRGLLSSNRVTDHVIAVSRRVEDKVCDGFPTTIIANGVDAARLAQTRAPHVVREQLGFTPQDFVLGSVARFTREKRMDLLIETVALLPGNFKLLLVGYGPRRAELLELANDRIPGRYVFVSAREYLGDYYRAMDAFCLASTHEGFGLVIPEAMLCEKPVITTNVGCVPEVLRHRVSGLVVDQSAQAFAEAATLVHSHPAWARGMALEGRAFADQHLHAARMARDYENLLLRLYRARCAAKREAVR